MHDFRVLHVKNRNHIDLRKNGALDVFDNETISFCFFLACEVGGSKFIENTNNNVQLNIIESNVQMYQVVFPWLLQKNIPFIFSSSYLQGTPHAYGAIKRLGEQWIQNLAGKGKIQRLWNVYGKEHVSLKSHVVSDWVNGCLAKGKVQSLSDGTELRQFIFVKDVAAALGAGMMHFDEIDMVSDVSSAEWISMKSVGKALEKAVADVANKECEVIYADHPSNPREHISPNMSQALHRFWRPAIDLEAGLAMVVAESMEIMEDKCTTSGSCKDRTEL